MTIPNTPAPVTKIPISEWEKLSDLPRTLPPKPARKPKPLTPLPVPKPAKKRKQKAAKKAVSKAKGLKQGLPALTLWESVLQGKWTQGRYCLRRAECVECLFPITGPPWKRKVWRRKGPHTEREIRVIFLCDECYNGLMQPPEEPDIDGCGNDAALIKGEGK